MSNIAATNVDARPSKAIHIALWVVQVLLGVMFVINGMAKAFQPMDVLAAHIPWTTVLGTGMTRFIGISELAGGLGLILPSLTRIKPRLTVFAALGLVVVMVLAAGYHVVQKEFGGIPFNIVLGSLAAFVAWGRLRKAPISPRG